MRTCSAARHHRSASKTIHAVSVFLRISIPDIQPARRSFHMRCSAHATEAGTGTATSAGLPSLPPQVRIPRRALHLREEFGIPALGLWASPHVPGPVHTTRRDDQHFVTSVSDSNECSTIPLGIQFTSRAHPKRTRTKHTGHKIQPMRYGSPACNSQAARPSRPT